LQRDLKIIALADGARLELGRANIDGFLEALQILQRELKRRLGQQNADKLLAHVEGQGALGVGDLGASDGRLILGSLQAPLPLAAAFEQVTDANVELLILVQVLARKVLRTE
jgi:hypothetical protein